LGAGLRAQARTQINLAMFEMADIKPAEGLRDIVFPVLWFADGIDSIEDPDTIHLLHTAINTPEKARSAL
jgi:scavenger receptor class B protein 1